MLRQLIPISKKISKHTYIISITRHFMRYNEQKVLPYIRAMVWRCYKISLRGFRRELRIVSKCGCLSESEGRVSTGAFTNQTCAVNRNRRKLFIMQIDRQPQTVRMNRWCPPKNKRDSQRTTASFGEGILLLMGCSQNYIMYWGVTSIIIYKCF